MRSSATWCCREAIGCKRPPARPATASWKSASDGAGHRLPTIPDRGWSIVDDALAAEYVLRLPRLAFRCRLSAWEDRMDCRIGSCTLCWGEVQRDGGSSSRHRRSSSEPSNSYGTTLIFSRSTLQLVAQEARGNRDCIDAALGLRLAIARLTRDEHAELYALMWRHREAVWVTDVS